MIALRSSGRTIQTETTTLRCGRSNAVPDWKMLSPETKRLIIIRDANTLSNLGTNLFSRILKTELLVVIMQSAE